VHPPKHGSLIRRRDRDRGGRFPIDVNVARRLQSIKCVYLVIDVSVILDNVSAGRDSGLWGIETRDWALSCLRPGTKDIVAVSYNNCNAAVYVRAPRKFHSALNSYGHHGIPGRRPVGKQPVSVSSTGNDS
jgi:hypothetical protein